MNRTRRVSRVSVAAKNKKKFIPPKEIKPNDPASACKIANDVYKEFANESTIHGVKYTAHAKTIYEKIIWGIIIILSVITAASLAQKFYEKHQMGNMRTLVISNQYPSWQVKMPAITICHPTIASLHRVQLFLNTTKNLKWPQGVGPKEFTEDVKYIREALYPGGKYQKNLERLENFLSLNNITIHGIFNIASVPCDDYIVLCQYEGQLKSCSRFLQPTYIQFGRCCSFNYAYVNNERRWTSFDDIYSFLYGDNFIVSLLIKAWPIEDRLSSGPYGNGYKVLIHERYTYPGPTAQEFVANAGSEIVSRLYGRTLTITPEVSNLPARDRECYLSASDTNLYRADNCYMTCREKKIRNLCNCVPFYSSIILPDDTVCNFSHIPCQVKALADIGTLSLWDKDCLCLPDCVGTTFQVVSTALPFNAPQFVPSPFYKTAKEHSSRTAIHITYSGQSFMLQRRELVLSWINLVSSVGGVFSLFLGCSFLSLYEVFYFFGWFIRKIL